MTTTAVQIERVPIAGPGWWLANVATITGRNLHRLIRVLTLIAFATVQPILLVLLFTYAWGGAIHPPGVTACRASPRPGAPRRGHELAYVSARRGSWAAAGGLLPPGNHYLAATVRVVVMEIATRGVHIGH
jgi:hypothetical protein